MATKAAEKTGRMERTAGLDLSREAARLLRALEGGGAYAIADPVAEGTVIVRQESAGVSLGGGRFPISAADELVRRDLVESSGAGAGRRFCISRVGVARRRRQTAPPDLAFPAQHQDLVRRELPSRAAAPRSRSTPRKVRSTGFAVARMRAARRSSTKPATRPESACAWI